MPSAQEPSFEIDNAAAVAEFVAPGTVIKKLAGGFRAAMGPAWSDAEGGFLYFADVVANKRFRFSPRQGISILRGDGKQACGHAFDLQGRLIACELGGRRLSRTEKDGSLTPLAERYNNKRLNGPSAIVSRPDGTLWFTDIGNWIKHDPIEQPGRYVYRLDLAGKQLMAVATDLDQPSGICFSADGSHIYLSDAGPAKHVLEYTVTDGKTLIDGHEYYRLDAPPYGLARDTAGRMFVAAEDGLHLLDSSGRRIARCVFPTAPSSNPIEVGKLMLDAPSACCFGGEGHKTLFITTRASLYALALKG